MVVSLSVVWKLAFAIALGLAIFVSACVHAPRESVPATELCRLVACALVLYAIGALASLTHHSGLAGLVFGAGISVAALAGWLSRGRDSEEPRGGSEPVDEQPPPEPEGVPKLDWQRFERDFREWSERTREPTSRH